MEEISTEYLIENNCVCAPLAAVMIRYMSDGVKMGMHTVISPEILEDGPPIQTIIKMMLRKEKVDQILSIKIGDYWPRLEEDEERRDKEID